MWLFDIHGEWERKYDDPSKLALFQTIAAIFSSLSKKNTIYREKKCSIVAGIKNTVKIIWLLYFIYLCSASDLHARFK